MAKASTTVGQVRRGTKRTAQHVKDAAAEPWVESLARFGYLIRGVIYATIGALALQLALGTGGATTNQTGAIARLGSQPFGKILLALMAVGLAGYALWGFIRAILDPLRRGATFKGLVERAGFLLSGISYGLLFIPTLLYALGRGNGSQSSNQDLSVQLFVMPFGAWLVAALGIFWIAAALGQLYNAYSANFAKDFSANQMSATEKTWALRFGRFGIGARGVVFALIGVFVVQGALTLDPHKAQGFDGALLKLSQAPYGTLLLGVVALGLVAFGVYSAFCARWIKVSAT